MSQITLYLDPETEKRMRSAAQEAGLSLSRWVVNVIREKTSKDWPATVRSLAGAWSDIPTPEELRGASGNDVPREPL